jgi:hypothetical protein
MRQVMARTVCQSCGAAIRTPVILLGGMAKCPKCRERTVPVVPVGGKYPCTGFEITYSQFCQLLEYPEYRVVVAPLIVEWFGYTVAETTAGIRLLNPAGEALDMLRVHLMIQADGPRHQALYQLAMSLWHG